MIAGTGTDIVATARVRALIDRYGDRFVKRWFGAEEIAYCQRRIDSYVHFASRLAAKEATFKVLRISGSAPLCWKDIVVIKAYDGAPGLALTGAARVAADKLGITAFHVSLSHGGEYAIAMVIGERNGSTGTEHH